MSNIKYGLISKIDAKCLEKTIDLICNDVKVGETIYYTEVGVYAGQTGLGLSDYIAPTGRDQYFTGIDNERDGEKRICFYDNMIIGNSNEVYNKIQDESQHLILIDALHTFPAVVSDFFCYAPKVMVGGYIAFHDTGKHLDPLSGWQGVGDKNDPDMCLGGVRRALEKLGLFGKWESDPYEWKLIFDEADVNDTGGGICVFKKMY